MRESTYLQMRTEMWKIEELEYACNCVMESFSDEGYDKESDDVVESAYGYNDNSAQNLIEEAEYVLATFYEPDHARNESLKYCGDTAKKECQREIRLIKNWIKKWKPLIKGGE